MKRIDNYIAESLFDDAFDTTSDDLLNDELNKCFIRSKADYSVSGNTLNISNCDEFVAGEVAMNNAWALLPGVDTISSPGNVQFVNVHNFSNYVKNVNAYSVKLDMCKNVKNCSITSDTVIETFVTSAYNTKFRVKFPKINPQLNFVCNGTLMSTRDSSITLRRITTNNPCIVLSHYLGWDISCKSKALEMIDIHITTHPDTSFMPQSVIYKLLSELYNYRMTIDRVREKIDEYADIIKELIPTDDLRLDIPSLKFIRIQLRITGSELNIYLYTRQMPVESHIRDLYKRCTLHSMKTYTLGKSWKLGYELL